MAALSSERIGQPLVRRATQAAHNGVMHFLQSRISAVSSGQIGVSCEAMLPAVDFQTHPGLALVVHD